MSLVYDFSVRCFGPFTKRIGVLGHPRKIIGKENIPKDGRCIIACRHSSCLDPWRLLVALQLQRRVRWIAKSESGVGKLLSQDFEKKMPQAWPWKILTIPVSRLCGYSGAWCTRKYGVVFVDRQRNTTRNASGMRKALEALENGEIIALFPEGSTKTPRKAHKGLGLLAYRSCAPVVPIWIDKEQIIVGKPVCYRDLYQQDRVAQDHAHKYEAFCQHIVDVFWRLSEQHR